MILVINSGSSSIKFKLFRQEELTAVVVGEVERIGEVRSALHYRRLGVDGSDQLEEYAQALADHPAALQAVFDMLAEHCSKLVAIGHRVVHGGERFKASVVIDDDVLEQIRAAASLAPLHNPANILGIEIAKRMFPNVPQVAVFDTAFHQTMPAHAFRYAIPETCYRDYQARRYGFHGASHSYVAKQAAQHLGIALSSLNLISLHLGNGASVAAIENGRCIDTSMGMTPMEGLMMGSRCGDIDPALPFYLGRVMGKRNDEIEAMLRHDSGLKGLCGASDMREVQRLARAGDERALLAIEMYCYRVKKYIGAYVAVLGRVDALVFTAGIGEHDADIRWRCCQDLAHLGIEVAPARNEVQASAVMDIHSDTARVEVLVVATDEESEIAEQALACIDSAK